MEIKKTKDFFVLNDAYNSNPFSLKESLKIVKRFPQKKIAIIGDMLELGEKSIYYHKMLAKPIIKTGFKYCLLMGEFSRYLKEELKKLGYKNVFHFSSHKKIAQFIKKNAKEDYLIFLKGSRKMELEKVISFLK
jgi:UDP-N-acetylmuramoyl-tripeptide--D-alanyl-D-alanine ligase